jgi:LuxR family maltose regulon positive regulatory protein
VPRLRLGELLAEGMGRKLTLISVPAGFGKTTLLSEWRMIHLGSEYPVAWVSLEEADNDPIRFLSYLIAALQAIEVGFGEAALASLRSPQPPPIESMLTALVNEIAAIPNDFALVLDDYHVIEAEPVHGAIAFLLEHMPPQMHLVIAGRTDLPLPLARLRARGQMTELRADDLRFTSAEATAFLKDVMGLDLSAKDIEALEERTEGWIAGLQLAALSMRGREDTPGFIEAFTGSNRYILDYLTEEVLERQPEHVTVFLLQTSILDRLSGALCDAVTDRRDGQAMLEDLERANLFIVPLDEERHWYRYHHLFADLLRTRLHQAQAELVPQLHRKACEWYERNGLVAEAIGHALAAADNERVARMVEQNAESMLMHGETTTLLRWLDALPGELVRSRPRLCILRAGALLITGQLDSVEPYLQDAERRLGVGMCSQTTTEVRDLIGRIAAIRANVAGNLGDVTRTIQLAHRALELLSPENVLVRSVVALSLGEAYLLSGDVAAASRFYEEAGATGKAAGHTLVAEVAMTGLARLQEIQGRLRQATETYRQALQWTVAQRRPRSPGAGMLHVGMGRILLEWNDLAAARRHLIEGTELGRQGGIRETLRDGYIGLARLKQAQGDVDGALDSLQEAEQLVGPYEPFVTQIAAQRARLWLARGDIEAAVRWARERGFSTEGELGYQRESEQVTLARVLLAQKRTEETLQLLERLVMTAEAEGRTASVIQLLVLQALALRALGDTTRSLESLTRALSLAEPEGYVRTFVDEGEPMAKLLSDMRLSVARDHGAAARISPEYVGKLLTILEQPPPKQTPAGVEPLAEHLSERELEVLRLVAAGMKNAEIAKELFVVVGTVKAHLNSIYRKLGVSSRTQAVSRARELGML